MLSSNIYQDLWKRHFSPFIKEIMPPYEEYHKLVRYYEGYLSNFSGKSIRYILVAEAAPSNGAYVYNFDLPCGLMTPYFKQVAKAFEIKHDIKLNTEKAKEALSEFTKEGILILDLFPFPIKYTRTRRNSLIQNGVVREFWDGSAYSIKTQIQELCTKYEISLDPNWDLCLIAPPIISTEIVENYNALDVKPCHNGIHNNTTFHALHPHELRKSKFKKVAVSKAGYPNATLIRIAFDL